MSTALRHSAAEQPSFQAPARLEATERLLAGHSGARVVLHSNGRDSFVRKTAASAAASARLKAQADKQHSFWMFGLPYPKVRAQTVDAAGIGSFDMNYIPGRTIADAVMNSSPFDPLGVVKAVERLMWLFATQRGAPIETGLFKAKIADVAGHALSEADDPQLRDAMQICARHLLQQDWSAIPETPSHGDLTLENILLTTGKSVAFIDCDDGFASSFWLDFGKLFQDMDGHWCIRALYAPGAEPVRRLNASLTLEKLGLHFRALAAEMDSGLRGRLPQLAALGLFRAIPYARSDRARLFLCDRIARVLEH